MCGLNLSYNCFSIPIVVVNICQVVLQAIELFFTFYSKLLFLGFWILCNIIYVLCISRSTVYSVTLTYAETFSAVYYRLLVRILDNRWSSHIIVHIYWKLFQLISIYNNTITHFYFHAWYLLKKQDYSHCEHWKNLILFIWKRYINILR